MSKKPSVCCAKQIGQSRLSQNTLDLNLLPISLRFLVDMWDALQANFATLQKMIEKSSGLLDKEVDIVVKGGIIKV